MVERRDFSRRGLARLFGDKGFYFACLPFGRASYFWVAHRGDSDQASSLRITAGDREARSNQEPFKWEVLQYLLAYPGGTLKGQDLGTVIKVKDEVDGEVVVHYRVGRGKDARTVYEKAIS